MQESQMPDEILDIIHNDVHQMRLRGSVELINRVGTSTIEDLPGLVDDSEFVPSYRILSPSNSSPPGWSQRVTEFLEKAAA